MSEVTEYAPGTPSWVDLATSDAAKASAFYCTLFGWTAEDVGGDEGGHYMMLRKDGKDVAALYTKDPEQGPPHWNTYVTVDNVDKAAERVESAGGTLIMEPFDVMDVGRMAVVQDPTAAFLALWEPRGHIGAKVVNEPGALCWNELVTSDRERASAFYGAVLGWGSHTEQMGPMTYTEFKNGENTVAGMIEMQGIPPHWAVYFAVTDADATVARASGLGGKVTRPAMDIPVGRIAFLADPQGAMFNIIQLAAPSAD